MLVLNRAFYAVQTNWVPTVVALGAVGVNAVFDALFYRLGIWGIPLATAAVNLAASAALLWMMRRRVGLERVGETARAVGRILLAAAVAAGVALGAWYGADGSLGRSLASQVVSLAAALVVAGAAYAGAARVFRVRELDELLLLRRSR
jgi:peptidoglycan biosynthesis protein MviN/MurJ (putative lipid II flippase)